MGITVIISHYFTSVLRLVFYNNRSDSGETLKSVSKTQIHMICELCSNIALYIQLMLHNSQSWEIIRTLQSVPRAKAS